MVSSCELDILSVFRSNQFTRVHEVVNYSVVLSWSIVVSWSVVVSCGQLGSVCHLFDSVQLVGIGLLVY